jgi:hypothetical protein
MVLQNTGILPEHCTVSQPTLSRYDKLCSRIMKACSVWISGPVNHMCNHLLASGTLSDMKWLVMKPCTRKGTR